MPYQIVLPRFPDLKDGKYNGRPMASTNNFRVLADKQMEIISIVNSILARVDIEKEAR